MKKCIYSVLHQVKGQRPLIPSVLFAILFCHLASAQNLTYTTSWLGNSGARDSLYVQAEIHALWVHTDGTSYGYSWFDEGYHRIRPYSSSGVINKPFSANLDHPYGSDLAGNNTKLFAAETNMLTAVGRSNGSRLGNSVSVPGNYINGIAASETEVFVSSQNGNIYVYNASTLAPVRNFNAGVNPGRMAIDGTGFLWVITGNAGLETGNTVLKRFSTTGTAQPQSISFTSSSGGVAIASSVAVNQANNTIYIIDRGKDQNIKVYTNITSSPTRVADLGAVGGIFSGTRPGLVGPQRFHFNALLDDDAPGHIVNFNGIGVDNSGNVYVLHGTNSGAHIEKYSSTGAMQWRLIGHTFEEGAYIDPTTDETDVYAGPHHYKMNYSAAANTEMASWHGNLAAINSSNAYFGTRQDGDPNQPAVRNFAGTSPIRIANISGSKFIWYASQLEYVYIYRIDPNSEVLVNLGITDNTTTWAPRGSLGDVDATGAMWSSDYPDRILKYPVLGVNNGVPQYNFNSPTTYTIPAPYTASGFVGTKYIAETDVMYLSNDESTSRYNSWSTSRTLVWTKDLKLNGLVTQSMDVAGDYIFTDYFSFTDDAVNGRVKVWSANTGNFVFDLVGPANYTLHESDNNHNTQAFKRSNGEYIITFLDHYHTKTVVFKWSPGGTTATVPTVTTTAISAITGATASSGGNVTSDGGASVTARGVVWSTSANPTTALTTKTTNGSGTGTFTSTITGLTPGTLYHVRAYATNSVGTSYGSGLTFTATSGGGSGALTGSVSINSNAVNLTTVGTGDWKHFRNNVRKASASNTISNPTVIGGSAINYTDDARAMSWTGGTPTATGTNIRTGKYIEGNGKGFSFTVPAGNGSNTLYVYAGGYNSGGTLTAQLSNSAAPDYVNTVGTQANEYNVVYTITYYAAQAGQTLTVSWKQASGTGNITIQAAALTGAAILTGAASMREKSVLTSIALYPNPASGSVIIDFGRELDQTGGQVEMSDLLGRKLYTSGLLLNRSTLELSTGRYPKGTYLITIIRGRERITKKLIVQ